MEIPQGVYPKNKKTLKMMVKCGVKNLGVFMYLILLDLGQDLQCFPVKAMKNQHGKHGIGIDV